MQRAAANMRPKATILLEPLFAGHVVKLGFIAGVGAKRAVILGDDGFAFGDEGLS